MLTKFSVRPAIFTVLVGTIGIAGCGGPKTYPVRGKVELAGGDIKLLAGSHVEAVLTTDPTVRASGEIQADGKFRLESLHSGVIRNGALWGEYQVRIILADDDQARRRQARQAVAPRYLDFKSSGVSLEVPVSGEVTITVSPP